MFFAAKQAPQNVIKKLYLSFLRKYKALKERSIEWFFDRLYY